MYFSGNKVEFSKLFIPVLFPNYKNHYSREQSITGNNNFVLCTCGIHLIEKNGTCVKPEEEESREI